MTTETVAVLGAGGTMGKAMARNLAHAGFAVRAWNRTPETAQDLATDGATVCATPAEAVPMKVRAALSAAVADTVWNGPDVMIAGVIDSVRLPEASEEPAAFTTNCCR